MSAAPSNSTSPRASAAPNFAALPATIAAAASGRPDSPNMAHQLPAGVTQGAAAPTPTQAAAAAAASHASAYRPQPQHGRLRARSIGKPAAAPAPLPQADSSELRQSPSRAGSGAPGGVLNAAAHAAGFARPSLNAQGRASSDGAFALASLARQRAAELDARRVTFSERAHELGGGGAGSAHETETGGTEESGSTQSDSPPHTPRDSYYHYSHDTDPRLSGSGDEEDEYWVEPPSRRGSSAIKEEREAWRTGGELHGLYDPALLTRSAEMPTRALPPMELVPRADDATSTDPAAATRNRSKSLEGLTRMSLRRGKSFTSLLVQPMPAAAPSPASSSAGLAEQRDPFLSGAADRAKLSAIAPTPVLAQFENPPILRPDSLGNLPDPRNLFPPATASLDPLATPKSLRDFVPQLLILFALFLSSFVVIALTIATLPGLFLPHSVSDLPALTKTLTTYRASSFTAEAHLFVVLTLLFLWKQCFSIPGSILTNILFGALYGTTLGTWWACLWTATGSTGAYLIAVVIAPLVEYYFAKPLDVTRRALKLAPPSAAPSAPGLAQADVAPPSDSDLFSHLLLARFFPLLPYSVLNVIAGVLHLPLGAFFSTLLIGSFPFNFATVSIGNLVSLAAADPSKPLGDKIWSREVVLKLVAVTLISVLPLAFKERLRALLSNGSAISHALDHARNATSRALFGFSAVPSSSAGITSSTASIAAQPSHRARAASSGGGGSTGSGPRAWRRKLSRSIGSATDLILSGMRGKGATSGAGAGAGAGAGVGYAYERIVNGAGESATGVLDDVEMGGVDPSRSRA